jgi:hypothetical protein
MASLALVDIALEMGDDSGGDKPTASKLQNRLDTFEASGQKKAAMAVTMLARDLRCVLELDPSQPAKLRCRRSPTSCGFGGLTRITAGGYLWSPQRSENGARNPFYEFMREVAPGDLVLSFEGTRIRAIGVARSYAYECPKPPESAPLDRTGA